MHNKTNFKSNNSCELVVIVCHNWLKSIGKGEAVTAEFLMKI